MCVHSKNFKDWTTYVGKYEFQHMHSRTHVVEHCCTSKSAKPLYTGLGRAVYCCKKAKKKKAPCSRLMQHVMVLIQNKHLIHFHTFKSHNTSLTIKTFFTRNPQQMEKTNNKKTPCTASHTLWSVPTPSSLSVSVGISILELCSWARALSQVSSSSMTDAKASCCCSSSSVLRASSFAMTTASWSTQKKKKCLSNKQGQLLGC